MRHVPPPGGRQRRSARDEASMTELTEMLGLTARAIRYYDLQGLIACERDAANRRRFDAPTRARLQVIAELRQAGLSLRDVAEVLAAGPVGGPDQLRAAERKLAARSSRLDEERRRVRQALAGLQERLGHLDGKRAYALAADRGG